MKEKKGEKIVAEKRTKEAVERLNLSEAEVLKLMLELRELQEQLEQSQHHRLTVEGEIHRQQKDIQSIQDETKQMLLDTRKSEPKTHKRP